MADIKEEMSKLESAYKGKEIKESILSALDKVNTIERTARTLDGHGINEFLTTDELNKLLPLDDEPTKDSTKAISSGNMYKYLTKLENSIDTINGNSSSSSSETIKSKLEYLNETKRQIRKAIFDKGVMIYDTDSFDSYPDKISQITMDANLNVQPLEITENGKYTADEGDAYNPITVNVPSKLQPKTITKNGTYKAENEDLDGYSEIDVSAESALTTKSVSGSDFPSDIEPITYKASDEEGIIGYTEIEIDLTDKVAEADPVIIDPDEVGEEYTYIAKDDGLYGWSKFSISIKETKEKFTVNFVSDGVVVYTETDVPKGESCSYKGDKLEKEGYIFSGWNPQPIKVEKDLKCIAVWTEDEKAKKEAGGGGGGGHTISDMTWDDVQAHPDYINAGDSKTIYWMPFTSNGRSFMGGNATAYCVYKGEQGTASTWTITINLQELVNNMNTDNIIDTYFPTLTKGSNNGGSSYFSGLDYTETPFCQFGKDLASAIKECSDPIKYPGQSNLNFKTVNKTAIVANSIADGMQEKTLSLSGLWLLSVHEMNGGGYETRGVQYPGMVYDNQITRSMRRSPSKASTFDKKYFNIEVNTITQDYLFLAGQSNFNISDSRDATDLLYGYVIDNKGYRDYINQFTGTISVMNAIKHNTIGAGASPNLIFGFCL